MKLEKASLKPLKQAVSGLPDMGSALLGIFYPITAVTLCKAQIDGFVKEIETSVQTQGVIQPQSPQQVAMKPEGFRAWKWMDLHCLPDLILKPDDIVKIDGVRYRVMSIYPYSQYGFMHYELGQNYEEA